MSHEVESTEETKHSGASSKTASVLKWLFFAELGILVILNFFIHNHHPHFALEKIIGFWAIFGLGAALILGRVAKGLAHTILGKNEDFYDV
jgi:hypothetical protein